MLDRVVGESVEGDGGVVDVEVEEEGEGVLPLASVSTVVVGDGAYCWGEVGG